MSMCPEDYVKVTSYCDFFFYVFWSKSKMSTFEHYAYVSVHAIFFAKVEIKKCFGTLLLNMLTVFSTKFQKSTLKNKNEVKVGLSTSHYKERPLKI